MKIVAINGSPKGKKSATYLMVEAFLKGARSAGAEAEHHLLATKHILPCRGCFHCWTKSPGKCIQKDDIDTIDLTNADLLLFATPLYVDNVSGLLKNFLDRTIRYTSPLMECDEKGESVHVQKGGKRPKMMVMANCGFPEESHFCVLRLLFRRMARNSQTELIAEIYRSQGPLLTRKEKELNAILSNYFTLLAYAGEEVVTQGKLSHDIQCVLEDPLLPPPLYRELVNRNFSEQM